MAKLYTSDPHFWHKNIIKYCPETRNFDSVEEMNSTILSNWNAKVKPDDEVYILGDVAFGKNFDFINKLNGRLFLTPGNHDHKLLKECSDKFEHIDKIMEVKDGDYRLILCHYRFYEWDGFYRDNVLHFHGHSHGAIPSTKKAIDIGMDNPLWNFQPVTLEEVLAVLPNLPDHPAL